MNYSDEHSGKVKSFMLDVLCPLITESDLVSNELLDIILINIVEPNKTHKKNAYLLAKELVIKCSDTLEPYLQAVSWTQTFSAHLRWINVGMINLRSLLRGMNVFAQNRLISCVTTITVFDTDRGVLFHFKGIPIFNTEKYVLFP